VPKIGRKVRIFSALEVANICGVVNQTAINWIKNGYLKAFTTPGGQYRIYAKDLAAFLDNRGMGDSGEALMVILEKANWSTLLITSADMDLNNKLHEEIYRNLPEFTVLKACDYFEMGLKMAEEKPGFIILDSELPGIEHDRILRLLKEDPAFGKPYIFVMKDAAKIHDSEESEASADGVFLKPLNVEALIKAIKNLEKQNQAIA
jgi:excisionase family DNA binding protein